MCGGRPHHRECVTLTNLDSRSARESVKSLTESQYRGTEPSLRRFQAMEPQDLSRAVREASDPTMHRRRGIIGLSLAAAGSMGLIALYQSGVIRHIPEPPLPALNADKVDASAEAFERFEVGDAFLGFVSYGV